MSYNIGQFRRNQLSVDSYSTLVPKFSDGKNLGQHTTIYNLEGLELKVIDSCIAMPKDSNNKELYTLTKGTNYFFTFKVNNFYPFRLRLYNTTTFASMIVKSYPSGAFGNQEVVFCPNDNYNLIIFEIIRNQSNITLQQGLGIDTNANTIFKLYELTNILTTTRFVNNNVNIKYLKKIGLQGPPGLLFCLNGEEMYLGKSGIFEVEDININNLAFVLKNKSPIPFEDAVDFFILDYQY